MNTAALAVDSTGAPTLERNTFRPSALARSLRVGPTKKRKVDIARDAKRAAVVLRPGMRQSEFRRVELRMDQNHLASLPIMVGAHPKKYCVPATPLCGLVITGSNAIAHPDERANLADIVRDAAAREMPILAMSDAAPLVLAAAGHEPPEEPHTAVLINHEVRPLKARRDIDRAIDAMAASPMR